MKWQQREANLLALIQAYRERECRRLIDRATEKAKSLLQQTYRTERHNLRRRVEEERARAGSRIEAAEAEMDTLRRRQQEATSFALLERAWPLLQERLLAVWQQPEPRWHWIHRTIGEAQSVLPHRHWIIRAPGWEPDHRQRVQALLEPLLDEPVECVDDPTLQAGLVILAGDARLDASIEGLLADRRRLEARLLGLMQEQEL